MARADEIEALRVLVACEYSGVVRDAFRALGHDAISCDLLPTEAPGPHHQGDVLPLLREPWDLVIAHPPCTYLCRSGLRWLTDDAPKYRLRWQEMIDGAWFFRACMEANAPRVAVENPSMHRWATKIVGRRYDQLVQPYMFGHLERKATGLWLKGLPPLIATEDVHAATMALPASERDRVHWTPPGPDRLEGTQHHLHRHRCGDGRAAVGRTRHRGGAGMSHHDEIDAVADWLGDMDESVNVFDYTDEATTVITINVETLARRITARQADALAIVKRACDRECRSPGKHTRCSSHESYRELRDALYPPGPEQS